MQNLLDTNQEETISKLRKFSILLVPVALFIIDAYFVRRDGEYIIIGDTVLTVGDLLLLFLLAIALVALMRPMEQKKYQRH
ncbi:hypothetical protein LCGC14_2632260 [marine sediment metagenome]|uniref:Uncharacterized protein n=1 Tax=marine sediment metagenome TaxID=412755 RepID=A0A0F8ZZS5_9ZZZZ|nr:MAG: hypothetical protein HeimC2_31490 [Candidatus Heimdallarchaeota archaeon LC_2]